MTPDASFRWTHGYSRAELERAQALFQLTFPPDLVALLLERRPVGGPDWTRESDIRPRLAWPFEALLFHVEENTLWWPEWGERPATVGERAEALAAVLARAPRLIPVFSHRYLPADPCEPGNPVFSVYGSDTILYGANLEDYFAREQEGSEIRPWPEEVKEIAFWSELVRRNGMWAE
jgi:hypothetical protein